MARSARRWYQSLRAVPVVWSEEREIAWKCPLPEWGVSTPIVWDDSVFVTSHTDDGRLLLQHLGARSGTILWTQQVGSDTAARGNAERGQQRFHALHNLASPSPVTNGKVVVAHYGNGDLAAYDFNGGQLWKRNLAGRLWTVHDLVRPCQQSGDLRRSGHFRLPAGCPGGSAGQAGGELCRSPRIGDRSRALEDPARHECAGRGGRRVHDAVAGRREWPTAAPGDGWEPTRRVRPAHRPAALVPVGAGGRSDRYESDGQ